MSNSKRLLALLAAFLLLASAGGSDAASPVSGAIAVRASALSTTVVVASGSGHNVKSLQCYNPNAGVAYVQLFDTIATVTLGTTTPTLAIGFTAESLAALSLWMRPSSMGSSWRLPPRPPGAQLRALRLTAISFCNKGTL